MVYSLMRAIARIFVPLFFKIEIIGLQDVKRVLTPQTPFIVCSNHSSWFDPVFIAAYFPVRIHFMAKKELFTNKLVTSFLSSLGAFPVDRNKADRKAIKTAIQLLRDYKVLGIFPEGTRSPNSLGKAQNGAAYLALKTNSCVVPVAIDGKLKFRAPIKIIYGSPLCFEEEKVSSAKVDQATAKIMQAIKMQLSEV